jgi:hypothetical protein
MMFRAAENYAPKKSPALSAAGTLYRPLPVRRVIH